MSIVELAILISDRVSHKRPSLILNSIWKFYHISARTIQDCHSLKGELNECHSWVVVVSLCNLLCFENIYNKRHTPSQPEKAWIRSAWATFSIESTARGRGFAMNMNEPPDQSQKKIIKNTEKTYFQQFLGCKILPNESME